MEKMYTRASILHYQEHAYLHQICPEHDWMNMANQAQDSLLSDLIIAMKLKEEYAGVGLLRSWFPTPRDCNAT